jgi:hypothetical protein
MKLRVPPKERRKYKSKIWANISGVFDKYKAKQ